MWLSEKLVLICFPEPSSSHCCCCFSLFFRYLMLHQKGWIENIVLVSFISGSPNIPAFKRVFKWSQAIRCDAGLCDKMQYYAIRYNVMRYNAMRYNAMRYYVIRYNAILCGAIWWLLLLQRRVVSKRFQGNAIFLLSQTFVTSQQQHAGMDLIPVAPTKVHFVWKWEKHTSGITCCVWLIMCWMMPHIFAATLTSQHVEESTLRQRSSNLRALTHANAQPQLVLGTKPKGPLSLTTWANLCFLMFIKGTLLSQRSHDAFPISFFQKCTVNYLNFPGHIHNCPVHDCENPSPRTTLVHVLVFSV